MAFTPLRPSILPLAALALALAVAAPVAGRAHEEGTSALDDHGTFEIISEGSKIGTETFEIHTRGDRIEAQGEDHLMVEQQGKRVEVNAATSLVLDSHFDPISYTWSQKGAQTSQLSVDFRPKAAHVRYKTLNGQEDRRDFKLDKDVVVLDDNAIHQYQLAIARYDRTKGGTQLFNAFVPQEALPGVITLTDMGTDVPTSGGDKKPLHHLLMTTDLTRINLWFDDEGRLRVVSAPEAHFEAVRK